MSLFSIRGDQRPNVIQIIHVFIQVIHVFIQIIHTIFIRINAPGAMHFSKGGGGGGGDYYL